MTPLRAVVFVLLLVAPATAATVLDLGPFVPSALNVHGVVVGTVFDPLDDEADGHAGIWASGVLTPLPERPGTQLSDALSISDSGRITGLEYISTNDVHAIVWNGIAPPTQIGPFSVGFDFSQALDADAFGNVVGTTSTSETNHGYFGFYAPGGTSPVPVGAGDLDADAGSSHVGAISGDGTTMLGEVTGTDASDGWYLWSTATPAAPGIKLDITPPETPITPFGASIYVEYPVHNAIARDGTVLGFQGEGLDRTWFVRAPDGAKTPVVGLLAANAINDDHVVVGTKATGNPLDPVRAAKWDPVTKAVTDLNTLLPDGSGFVLYTATAVGDNGDIVGVALHDGVQVGFLLKAPALTASAAARQSQVKVEPNAEITVDVTLANGTAGPLGGVGPTGPPTVAGTGTVELFDGPSPATLDLPADQSGTITYRFRPTKAGKVTFTFPGFADASGTVTNDEGAVSTGEVKIVDLGVEVTVTPAPLANDSTRGSFGVVRIKVTDSKGAPIAGQRVRLKVPRWVGSQRDTTPALLVCDANGGRIFPPGDSAILDVVRIAPTDASGEIVYGLWLGTDRTSPASTQLLVLAEALDDADALLADGSQFLDVSFPAQGPPAPPNLVKATLNERQTAELPPAQRTDFAGITGRGSATEVLQSTMRWLLSRRELGLPALRGVDFAPIASADGANTGVVFFPQGRGRAVLDHLSGTGEAPGDASVMLIEQANLEFTRSVHWTQDLMPLATWETSRPLNNLGVEAGSGPVRGRAVSAVPLVTSDPHAFFGYPYPTTSPTGAYAGSCLPVLHGTGVDVHSPVTLLVKDAEGRAVGFDAAGAYTNALGGGTFADGEPAQYLLPPGVFTADINGTDAGRATLVMTSAGAGPVTTKVITLKAKPGKTGTLTLDAGLANPSGTFNKRKLKVKTGVPLKITGLKRRAKVRSGDELRLSVQDAFGLPVQGARVQATGKGYAVTTVTATDGSAALPMNVTKSVKLAVEVSGAGLQTKKQKVAVKVRK